MKSYVAVRAECEAALVSSGLKSTILRPWYVLGPGHRWPHLLLPFYWLLEKIPRTREGARRLGLVTLDQLTARWFGRLKTGLQARVFWRCPRFGAGRGSDSLRIRTTQNYESACTWDIF